MNHLFALLISSFFFICSLSANEGRQAFSGYWISEEIETLDLCKTDKEDYARLISEAKAFVFIDKNGNGTMNLLGAESDKEVAKILEAPFFQISPEGKVSIIEEFFRRIEKSEGGREGFKNQANQFLKDLEVSLLSPNVARASSINNIDSLFFINISRDVIDVLKSDESKTHKKLKLKDILDCSNI